MTVNWSAEEVAEVLRSAFLPAQGTKQTAAEKGNKGPREATIDVLLTFDKGGVSEHVNHISLYYGVRNWLEGLMKGRDGWRCPVEMYALTSTNIARKYISILDAPLSMIWGVLQDALNRNGDANRRSNKGRESATESMPKRLLFVSDMAQYRAAQKAMTRGHQSQMRWFRWGWIAIGRYMIVNDLDREIIK